MKKNWQLRLSAGAVATLLSASLAIPVLGAGVDGPIDLNRFTAGDPVDVFDPVLDNGDAGDHTHGSGIAVLPNGELICVWFQGNGERDATTTRIMASRLPVGETEWTEPFVMADAPGIADINPTVFVGSDNRLWMFWYPVLSGMWETSQPRFAYAEEGTYEFENIGNQAPDWTWSDIIPIKIGANTGNVVQCDTDEFVLDAKAGYAALDEYSYADVNLPESEEDVYSEEENWSIYEDGNTGGGMVAELEKEEIDAYIEELIAKMGGDPDMQLFTPTVADKVGPRADGTVQRSGYPLLRRVGWQTKNAPLEVELPAGVMMSNDALSEGGEMRLIVPLYSDGLEMSINAITDDGGKTWMMSKPLVGMATIQASMGQRENGEIVALMRNNGPTPARVAYSISEDYGMTWSTVKTRTDLFEPGVGNCMTVLPNGHWVFVANGVENGRNVMSIALSENEGKTWNFRRTLELDTRNSRGSYHYPSIVAAEDGTIYISYTVDYSAADGDLNRCNNIKVMQMTEDWIKEGDWTDEDTSHKAVFGYEISRVKLALPEDFDPENKDEDGTYKMEEIEKLMAAMPATMKGYLTYNNHGEDGLELAAPEYVDIPVTFNAQWVKQNFELGEPLEKIPAAVNMEALEELGLTEEMLPADAPMFYTMLFQEQ